MYLVSCSTRATVSRFSLLLVVVVAYAAVGVVESVEEYEENVKSDVRVL